MNLVGPKARNLSEWRLNSSGRAMFTRCPLSATTVFCARKLRRQQLRYGEVFGLIPVAADDQRGRIHLLEPTDGWRVERVSEACEGEVSEDVFVVRKDSSHHLTCVGAAFALGKRVVAHHQLDCASRVFLPRRCEQIREVAHVLLGEFIAADARRRKYQRLDCRRMFERRAAQQGIGHERPRLRGVLYQNPGERGRFTYVPGS